MKKFVVFLAILGLGLFFAAGCKPEAPIVPPKPHVKVSPPADKKEADKKPDATAPAKAADEKTAKPGEKAPEKASEKK